MYIFIGIFIILLIITILYFRYKNQFWRIQPVFHIFDLSYYFCKPYVILEELPKTNKFCNFQNIETKTKLTSDDTVQFTKIIQDYFIQNKYLPDNKFLPKSENILPYFSPVDQKNPNFFSFYKESHMTNDLTTGKVTESSKIIAVMTSRPITVSLNSNIEPLKRGETMVLNVKSVDELKSFLAFNIEEKTDGVNVLYEMKGIDEETDESCRITIVKNGDNFVYVFIKYVDRGVRFKFYNTIFNN